MIIVACIIFVSILAGILFLNYKIITKNEMSKK